MNAEEKIQILKAVDSLDEFMWNMAKKIHANPELSFEEHKAMRWLSKPLEDAGFKLEKKVAGLETAFKATWHGSKEKPVIAFLCEYDALPKLGHACGHNLIGTISVGAALALKSAIPDFSGSIVVIGTPAEEGGGGKVIMCDHGVFDGIDAAMMFHGKDKTMVTRGALAAAHLIFKYHGKASHASSFPEKGTSALDAVVQTFTAINSIRQFIKDGARVHGIITNGGDAPNIVPDYCEAVFIARAPDQFELKEIKNKVINAAKFSAESVGARFECEQENEYAERNNNPGLAKLVRGHLEYLGETVVEPTLRGELGSSDIGNVSQIIPTLHPYIKICDGDVVTHSKEFEKAAISEQARTAMLTAAKALALTAFDLCNDEKLMSSVLDDLKCSREREK